MVYGLNMIEREECPIIHEVFLDQAEVTTLKVGNVGLRLVCICDLARTLCISAHI